MTLKVYLMFSVLFQLFMFTIWTKNNWLNLLIKFAILLLTICGILITLRVWGI